MSTLSPDLELEPAARAAEAALEQSDASRAQAEIERRRAKYSTFIREMRAEIDAARADARFLGRTHGKRSTYKAGCHCAPCSEANSTYFRGRREREREELSDPLRACRELLSSLVGSGGQHGNTLRAMIAAERDFDSDQMCGYRMRRIGVRRGEEAFASWDRRHCGKIACLHCGPGVIEEKVKRMLSAWGEDPVYRVELSGSAWNGRAIREDSGGRYIRIAVAEGSVVYGPGLDGDLVKNVGRQLTEDILRAPWQVEKGGFRIRSGKVVRAAEKAEKAERKAAADGLWIVNPGYTLEELRRAVETRGSELRFLGNGKKADDRYRAKLSDASAAEIIEEIESVESGLGSRNPQGLGVTF